MIKNIYGFLLILLSISVSIIGCTKYYNPEPLFEEYEQEKEQIVKRKVLVISIDGLVGSELEKDIPTNIKNLMTKSKYSFGALADPNTSDPSSWTTLLTGYSTATHRILDESYMPAPNSVDPHGKIDFMPTIIYRLENISSSKRTSTVVRNSSMANLLLMDADNNLIAKNDEDVKENAISLLNDASPDLLVLQFTSVLEAGKSNRFSIDNTEYAEAIKKVDEYVGDIVRHLESKEDSEFEDWLIILTSNHGGIGNSYGGESFQERNIFTLYYHKHIVSQELNAQMMNALRFAGHNTLSYGINATNNASGASNQFNANDNLTFEIKYNWAATKTVEWEKNDTPIGDNVFWYSSLLSKKRDTNEQNAGWGIFAWNENIAFSISDGTKGLNIQATRSNGTWGILTGRIKRLDNGNAEISLFKEGALVETRTIENFNFDAANDNILTLGYTDNISHELPDFSLANLRIWKRALSDQEIKDNLCKDFLTNIDLQDEKLLGEWNFLNADEIKISNSLPSASSFLFQGSNPRFFTEQLFTPCAIDQSEILIENKDIASHVFYWLGAKISDDWKFEGKNFLKNFEVEFLKP